MLLALLSNIRYVLRKENVIYEIICSFVGRYLRDSSPYTKNSIILVGGKVG